MLSAKTYSPKESLVAYTDKSGVLFKSLYSFEKATELSVSLVAYTDRSGMLLRSVYSLERATAPKAEVNVYWLRVSDWVKPDKSGLFERLL